MGANFNPGFRKRWFPLDNTWGGNNPIFEEFGSPRARFNMCGETAKSLSQQREIFASVFGGFKTRGCFPHHQLLGVVILNMVS